MTARFDFSRRFRRIVLIATIGCLLSFVISERIYEVLCIVLGFLYIGLLIYKERKTTDERSGNRSQK